MSGYNRQRASDPELNERSSLLRLPTLRNWKGVLFISLSVTFMILTVALTIFSFHLYIQLNQTKADLESLRQQFEDTVKHSKSVFYSNEIHTEALFLGGQSELEQRRESLITKDSDKNNGIIVLPPNGSVAFQHALDNKFPVDITSVGNINSSGKVTAREAKIYGRLSAQEYLQIAGVAVEGEMCYPDGLIGQNTQGGIVLCQSNVWKSICRNGFSLIGQDNLDFNADASYKSIIVTVSSKFGFASIETEGINTAYSIYNVSIDGFQIDQVTTRMPLESGYPVYGHSQRQFFTNIQSGSNIRILLSKGYMLLTSDIRVDLMN